MKSNLFNIIAKEKKNIQRLNFKICTKDVFIKQIENDNNKIINFILSKNSKYFDNKEIEEKFTKICKL